jgi:hypothetical protein
MTLTPPLDIVSDNQSNQFVAEMIRNQLGNVSPDRRLLQSDMQRMVRFITTSIFLPDKCSLWQGYVTDRSKTNKGAYINFYFHGKKFALHRLLYINFLGPLKDDEYVKFKCKHKGHCCSVHCLAKQTYRTTTGNQKMSYKHSAHHPPAYVLPSITITEDRLNIYFI